MKDETYSFKQKKQVGSKLCKLGISMFLMVSMFAPYMTNVNAQEAMQDTNKSSSRTADVTKPVIEKVEFPGNGKSLAVDEQVPIYIYAYDADSGIQTVEVNIEYKKSGNSQSIIKAVQLSFNDETNRYEGNIKALNGGYITARVLWAKVVDEQGNYALLTRNEQTNQLVYDFSITGSVEVTHKINKVELDKNQQTINREDDIVLKVYIDKAMIEDAKELNVRFQSVSHSFATFSLTKDQTSSTATENVYVIDSQETLRSLTSGKWIFDSCYAYIENEKVDFDYDAKDTIWFTMAGKADTEKPTITSIVMQQAGKMLQSGDQVEVKIKASDNVGLKKENAHVYFEAAADLEISTQRKYVSLAYSQTEDAYIGTFTIDNDTYPCEWMLSDVSIYDTSSNQTSFLKFVGSMEKSPYYVQVKRDGTYVNPTYDIKGNFYALNAEGGYVNISEWSKTKVERRSSLKEIGVSFPKIESAYKGLKFVGWVDSSGNPVDEATLVMDKYQNYQYYAKYDKLLVSMVYNYPDKDLNYCFASEQKIVPYGTTYADVLAMDGMRATLQPYQGEGLNDWEFAKYTLMNGETLEDEISFSPNKAMYLQPVYENRLPIVNTQTYVNKNAVYFSSSKVQFVDQGTTFETIKSQVEKGKAPDSLSGLRFKKWKVNLYQQGEIKEAFASVSANATYENCFAKFLVDDQFKTAQKSRGASAGFDESKIQSKKVIIAEYNETITVPEFPEYKSVVWISGEVPSDGKIKVTGNVTFYGYGVKAGEPETPQDPNTPETPDDSDGGIPMEKEDIDEYVNIIQGATPGMVLEIPMGNASVISKDLLEAAKGKNVVLNLNMGGYTWSIHGNDILSSNLKNINLEVSFDQNKIPSNTIKELAGDNPIKQLSLTHEGDFGFKANLSFNIGSEYTGKFGNLYYYDSDGKLVFMNAGKIDESGSVSLSFSHASDYVVVIKETSDELVAKDDNAIKSTGVTSQGSYVLFGLIILAGAYVMGNKKENVK